MKEKIKITTVSGVLLLLYLLVPIANLVFTSMRLTMSVLTILCLLSVIALLVMPKSSKEVSYTTIKQVIYFSLWIALSTLIFYVFYPMSNKGFYLNLWFLLIPLMLVVAFTTPNKKSKTLLEVIMLLGLLVNLYYVLRAINVYADAIRATETAEGLGYGNLLTGLVSYAQVYSLPLIIPTIMAKISNSKGKKKLLPLIALAVSVVMVFLSNLATAGLLCILGIVLYLIMNIKSNKKYIYFLVFCLLLIIGFAIYEWFFETLISWVGADTTWGKKLADILKSIQLDEASGSVAGRTELYEKSWNSFLASPILGAILNPDCYIGGHSTLLDILAGGGIVGFSLYAMFMYMSYKAVKKTLFFKENAKCVKITYIVFIALICFKNTITSFAIYATMFGFLPLYYALYVGNEGEKQ